MDILPLISFSIFIIYLAIVFTLFEIPESLSNTFYLFKEYNCSWVFTVVMTIMAITLIPSWLELLEGSNWQFMAFLGPIAIIFMSFAPNFKTDKFERTIHIVSALISAILSLLVTILTRQDYYIILIICSIVIFSVAVMSRSIKSSYLFWLEIIIFLTTYCSIIF